MTCRHVPPMRQRVVAIAVGKSREWRRVRDWLSSRFLLACRSGYDEPMVGSLAGYGAVTGKVHQRIFPAVKRFDGSKGVLELPRTKVGWPE